MEEVDHDGLEKDPEVAEIAAKNTEGDNMIDPIKSRKPDR